jgi:hypothetical protein
MQVVARRDERRFEILDGLVQRAELEIREARPEEALRLQRPVFPAVFLGQKPKRTLEGAEGALVVSHGEAQPGNGRVRDRKLPLDGRVLGFLVRRLEHTNCAIRALDGELDVADALADEAKQMQSGRVVGALFEVSIEREECREEVVW